MYKSSQRSKKVRLQHFFTPDKSTVTSLVYKKHCLYVGLVSGSVAVYSRSQGVCFRRGGTCEFVYLFCYILRILPLQCLLILLNSYNWGNYEVKSLLLCETEMHSLSQLDLVLKLCRLKVFTSVFSLR